MLYYMLCVALLCSAYSVRLCCTGTCANPGALSEVAQELLGLRKSMSLLESALAQALGFKGYLDPTEPTFFGLLIMIMISLYKSLKR